MEEKTRVALENELRRECGDTPETDLLIDWLKDAWETRDLFVALFGPERAHAIIHAPAFLPSPIREVMVV